MTILAAAPAASNVVTGVLAFLVVAAMGVALFFLLRSFNKQLRKVMPPEPKWRQSGVAGPAATSGSKQNGSAGSQPVPPDTP